MSDVDVLSALPLLREWEIYQSRKRSTYKDRRTSPTDHFYVSTVQAMAESEDHLFWLRAIFDKYGDMKFAWRHDGCEFENGDFYRYGKG